MKYSTTTLGYWALTAISILWGTTWFVSKLLITEIPPLQLCAIRQGLAGIIFVGYFNGYKKINIPHWREMVFHVALGFLFFTCSNGFTTFAIKYIPSFLGALIGCLMPFVMVLCNLIWFKTKVKPITLLGLGVGFSGVSVILSSFSTAFKSNQWFALGVLITLFTVFTWTIGSLLSTHNKWKYEARYGIGWQMLYGALMLYVISFFTEEQINVTTLSNQSWMLLTYLVLIGSVICFQCYLYALKHLPINLVSVYVYINPIVALLMGVMLLNEMITWTIVIGALITFMGIYLVKKYAQ